MAAVRGRGRRRLRAQLLLAAVLGFAAGSSSEQEELRYGIVFDAGSSGSRIHVYTWRDAEEAGGFDLVEDDLVKVKPGLSAFAQEPAQAGASLAPLLEHAERKVPADRRGSTPVLLMATAGLRLAGEEAATAILRSVAETLDASPFLFRREWAAIMPGTDEGVFGWMTVNYLLGTLVGNGQPTTSGVIDLGGGSVQFVYAAPPGSDVAPEHRSGVSFAGQTHELYVRSHLGFGLDEARTRTARRLVESSDTAPEAPVRHPCLPLNVQVSLPVGNGSRHAFRGTGSFEQCSDLLRGLFRCAGPPCAFDPASRPPLPGMVFGFSYLFDRTRAIGLLDGEVEAFGIQHMSVADIRRAAAEVCSARPVDAEDRFAGCEDASKWANFCGDATYIAELLEHGFGIDPTTNLTMGNKIGSTEVVWTLGAIIAKSDSLRAAPVKEEL